MSPLNQKVSQLQEANQLNADLIRKAFSDNGHESELYEKINESFIIHWQPAWQQISRQAGKNNTDYSYIPLNPKLKIGDTTSTFDLRGVKRFIVVKQSGAGFIFSLATYNFRNPGADNRSQNTSKALFRSFTGSLLLKNLTDGSLGTIEYRNGIREAPAPEAAAALSASSTSGWDCKDVYICYWSYPCGGSSGTVVGTTTRAVGGTCADTKPTDRPIGCNWGQSWSYQGSYYEGKQCNYDYGGDDPPLPGGPGGGPYDGGGGGGGPAPVVKITADASITGNPVANCIYGKVGPGNHGYDKFLIEFQKSTKYNVTFKLVPNLTAGGVPANGFTNYQTGSTNVTIFINSSTLNRPSWEVAGTFTHEMAHAYLAQKLISIGGPGNLKQHATDTKFKDLFDYYAKYVGPETGKYTATQNSAAHHNLMADKLITDIAEGIRDYVEANTPSIKNYPEITLEHYKAVAWNGLRDTEAFMKLSKEAQENTGKNTTLLQSYTVNNCK